MEPRSRRHVEVEIGVVHSMEPPERRNRVEHHMLQVDREIEQHERDDEPGPAGKRKVVEEAPASGLGEDGETNRGDRKGEAQREGVEDDDAEIAGPTRPARDRASPSRRQCLQSGHAGERAAKERQPDRRFMRQEEVRHSIRLHAACLTADRRPIY